MDAGIQWFDPALGAPVVSIARSGLTFNKAAVAALGEAAFVEVGVDAKAKAVVVRSVATEGAGEGANHGPGRALPFWKPDAPNPFVRLSSKELVRFIKASVPEIDTDRATKYQARYDPEGACLWVDLRQPIGRRRSGKGPAGRS